MVRDNVWTNGTKDRISNGNKISGTPEYTAAEEWTRSMPGHIPDDIMGPTTSRTAAPAIDGVEKSYNFEDKNVTMKGPSKSEIAETIAPKKTTVTKKETETASAAAGVDIDAEIKADKKKAEEAKAEAASAKAEAAKAKAEA